MDQLTARKLLKSRARGNTPTGSFGGPRSPASKNNSALHLDDFAHADSSSTLNSLHVNQKLSSSSYGGHEVEPVALDRNLSSSTTKIKVPISLPESSKVEDDGSDIDYDLENDDALEMTQMPTSISAENLPLVPKSSSTGVNFPLD